MNKLNYAILSAALCFGQSVQAADLMSLYQETVKSFPGLDASEAQIEASEARVDQAVGDLLPQVSFTGSRTRTRHESGSTVTDYNGKRYALSLTQSLYDKPKYEYKKLHQSLTQQSKERYLGLLATVSVDLIERYVTVLSAEDVLSQITAEKDLTQRQLDLLRSMYKRQLAVLTDVLDIEARLDGLKAQQIVARNDVATSRENLGELVGRDVVEPLDKFVQELNYVDMSDKPKSYWTEKGIENSHQLKELRENIKSAKTEVSQAKAGHLPTVSFRLEANKSNIGFENSRSADTNKSYVASLNLSIPIYSGGKTSARKREQVAKLRESRAQYEEARRAVLKDIREAYLGVTANKANISASKTAIVSAEKSYDAMSKGLEYGTVTVVDVLDAKKEVLRNEIEFRKNQYDYAVNWINLLRLSGQLDEESITQANAWLDLKKN
ncbi:MAG: TolC family outer membrane protein [Pseudomonadales bacterium]